MPDKARERYYLTQRRRAIELPGGEPVERERPDFVLGAAPRRLGIELTELHPAPQLGERPFQEVQSLKERVVREAERLFHQAGGKALYVTVIFGRHGRLDKNSVNRIARELANALLSVQLPTMISEGSVDIPRDILPREIGHAHVFGSVDGEDRLWSSDHGGWIRKLEIADVQRELDRKSGMAAEARTHCDELWLVVVHSIMRGAPSEVTPRALDASFNSVFDRVVWLEPEGPRARELAKIAG